MRRWDAWHRHITLSLLAHAALQVTEHARRAVVTDGALHSLPFDTNPDTNVGGTWRYSADRRSVSRWRTWLTLAEYTDAAITSERPGIRSDKEEVPGSSPGSPPHSKLLNLQVKRRFTVGP